MTTDKQKEYQKKYKLAHSSEIAEYKKAYRLSHQEKIKEYRKRYSSENRDKELERKRKYYKEHAEEISKKAALWAINNPDRRKQQRLKERVSMAKYRESHIEQRRASNRKYAKEHPEIYRLNTLKYKTMKRLAVNDLKRSDIDFLFLIQDGICVCCGKALEKYHVDHILPVSRGGGLTINNVQLLCPRCNQSKNNKEINYIQPYLLQKTLVILGGL